MRVCRYEYRGRVDLGFYGEDGAVPGAETLLDAAGPMDLLPHGRHDAPAQSVYRWAQENPAFLETRAIPLEAVRLLRPIETPGKVLLLAGNYAAHVREGGETAVEREQTFPYVFIKPPTTFNDPNAPIPIPPVSPDHIDYECELAVVIGSRCKGVEEGAALAHVAGYTVVNDISDRRYKPFPGRRERPKDGFFDWLHGKWHDGFCPMGPCVASARDIPDPQALALTQHVNGELRQNASTAQMIFPVAAVIAFISQWVTLLPGDIISTGTPEGIGMPTGNYLRPGDTLAAAVEGIGILHNVMTGAQETRFA